MALPTMNCQSNEAKAGRVLTFSKTENETFCKISFVKSRFWFWKRSKDRDLNWPILEKESSACHHVPACSNQLKNSYNVAIDWINIFDLVSVFDLVSIYKYIWL
jgi:hypothetical protein